MSKLDFPVFDADNHLYETEDAFTRHLPSQYRGLIKYVQVNGRTKIAVDNVISDYIPNPTFEVVARPGALADYFAGKNTGGRSQREIIGKPMRAVDAFRCAGPRLRLLDELGLDAALMIPTLASLLEVRLTDDPDLTCTVIHAFNEWMHDEWKFDYQGRIYQLPLPGGEGRAIRSLLPPADIPMARCSDSNPSSRSTSAAVSTRCRRTTSTMAG